MTGRKPRILIFVDWFLPGYKAGGPIRSVANLVSALHQRAEIGIVTSDRDFGDNAPYAGINSDCWLDWEGKARVWYCSPEKAGKPNMKALLESEKPDLVYLNSMFSFPYALGPMKLARNLSPRPRILLAPRGMLNKGALSIKKHKKRLFLFLARTLGWFKGIEFQATSEEEVADIIREFGKDQKIGLVANLPREELLSLPFLEKVPGELRLVFLSRVSPKKNLEFILQRMDELKGKGRISLEVVGPVEEESYREKCLALTSGWPETLQVHWRGAVLPEAVGTSIQAGHVYVLPTLGENFGHSIFEAYLAGRPVLISDKTPWLGLKEKGTGWDIPLDQEGKWRAALEEALAWDQAGFEQKCQSVQAFATDYLAHNEELQKNVALFIDQTPLLPQP